MITVRFHKSLQKYTNVERHEFDVSNISSLVQGVINLFPSIKGIICQNGKSRNIAILNSKLEVLSEAEILRDELRDEFYYLVPLVQGSGDDIGMIFIGLAIAAFAYFALPALVGVSSFSGLTGVGLFAGKALLGIGINMALGGLMQMLNPPPKNPNAVVDAGTRRNNDAFSSLDNTTSTNEVLAHLYGFVRISGQFISGSIKTIDHGKNDIVRVAESI